MARPRVVDRRRLVLTEKTDHDSVFVYHAAAELEGSAAERYLEGARRIARARAHLGLQQLLSELLEAGLTVVGAAVPRGASRALPALTDILRSHSFIHAAEGLLFREALAEACGTHGLAARFVDAKRLPAAAARASGIRAETLKRRIAELGRTLGPPWTVDQKEATLAALVALGGEGDVP
jgi:hypothetical protein